MITISDARLAVLEADRRINALRIAAKLECDEGALALVCVGGELVYGVSERRDGGGYVHGTMGSRVPGDLMDAIAEALSRAAAGSASLAASLGVNVVDAKPEEAEA